MSSLKLTEFNKTFDLTKYVDYELSCKPETGNSYFVYHKEGEKVDNNPIDIANIATVKRVFKWAFRDKFDKMATTVVKDSKNVNGSHFITSRTTELSNMYNELADMFLKYLHKSVWNTYNKDIKKYVLSTIDFQDAYDDLKMGIESFELILTKIINDKFDEKYAEIETKNSIR